MSRPVLDLFAGPGGWDLAARLLDLHPLGVEWDDAACATRRAAGLWTIQEDVGALDPQVFARAHFGSDVWGLIASPPCQAFSMAGKGAGRGAMSIYEEAIDRWMQGKPPSREALDVACDDERAHLVLEPLRWALALRPRWIALEQVEPVLPLWKATARALSATGYSTWTATVSAEQFGVPQTRRRAILLASLDQIVKGPVATHQRFVAPRVKDSGAVGLFDAPDPERIVHREDRGLLPWISMAEALRWQPGLAIDHHRGAGMTARHGERTDRTTSQPAPAVTAGGSRWGGGPRWTLRSNAQPNATVRSIDEPAPTIKGGHDHGDRQWIVDGGAAWTEDRPATTVAGDSRIFPPGHKINADDVAAGRGGQRRSGAGWTEDRPATVVTGTSRSEEGGTMRAPSAQRPERGGDARAVRVTADEAAVLQSFPMGYPWQGTKSKVFEQIGNAIPPLLALALLATLVEQ